LPFISTRILFKFFLPFSTVCVYTELFIRGALTARRKFYLVGDNSYEVTPEIIRIKKKKREKKEKRKKGKKKRTEKVNKGKKKC
jgi:hypothetical protein